MCNLIQVNSSSVAIPLFQAAAVVKEFPKVILDDIPGVPLESKINFGIDILPDTHPISILPHRMAPVKRVKGVVERSVI